MPWKKAIMAAVTGEGNDWDTETLRAPGFLVGSNPELLIPDMKLQPGDRVELQGKSLYELLLKHEVVILQHFPPPTFIDRLKDDGVQQVLLFVDYESIPQQEYWSIFQKDLWKLGMQNRYISKNPNRYGNYWVDAYEASQPAPPLKPHTFAVDVYKHDYASKFVQQLGNLMFQVYGNVRPRLFIDNCMDRPYYGTSTNAPDRNNNLIIKDWQSSFKTMLSFLRKTGLEPIWGNCAADTDCFPELDVKFDELVFTSGLAPEVIAEMVNKSMETAIIDRKGKEQGFCFHASEYGGGTIWANDPKKWAELKAGVTDEPCYVMTARTSMLLFHPGQDICT